LKEADIIREFFNKRTINLMILLCAGWTLLYTDRTTLYPLLSVIGEKFSLSGTQLGTITSSYFLVYVAMQIPSGMLGDRIGKKRLLTAMYAISGFALLCFGLFTGNYVMMIFLMALHGFGAGAYYPSAYGIMLKTVAPQARATAAAIVNLGMSFGLIIGLATSGPIYLYTRSYGGIFTVLGIITVFMALIYYKALPETDDLAPDEKSSNGKSRIIGLSSHRSNNEITFDELKKTSSFPIAEVLKNKNLMLINLAQFCALYGYWVAVTWGAVFFQKERGIGMELAGLFVAIAGISAIMPSLISGRISDRIGRKKMALLLFPLGALTIFLMAYMHSTLAIISALIAYGIFGKSSWDPIAIAWTGDHAAAMNKDALGTAVGVFNFSGMMSAVVAPMVSGFIRDLTGSLVSAFYVAAIISLLGLFFVSMVDEKPEF
jgi:MFS family permease